MTADEKRIKELEAALKPFAEFSVAYKEWRFGKAGTILQSRREPHIVTARWTQPQPMFYTHEIETVIQFRELHVSDFILAEKVFAS